MQELPQGRLRWPLHSQNRGPGQSQGLGPGGYSAATDAYSRPHSLLCFVTLSTKAMPGPLLGTKDIFKPFKEISAE